MITKAHMLPKWLADVLLTVQVIGLACGVTYVGPKWLWNAHKSGTIKGRTSGRIYDRRRNKLAFYSILLTGYVAVFVTYFAVIAVIDIWRRHFKI